MRRAGRGEGEVVSLRQWQERKCGGIVSETPADPFGRLLAGDAMDLRNKHADFLIHQCLFGTGREAREAALGELVSRKDWRSLIKCMGCSDGDIGARAFGAVSGMGLGDELLAFRELQENPNVRHHVMLVLESQAGRYAAEGRGAPLFTLAEGSENQAVRSAALRYFIEKKADGVLKTLARTSMFKDVREACLKVLEPELKKCAKEGSLGLLTAFATEGGSAKVRADAIRALYSMGAAANLQVISVRSVHEEDREHAKRLAGKLSA